MSNNVSEYTRKLRETIEARLEDSLEGDGEQDGSELFGPPEYEPELGFSGVLAKPTKEAAETLLRAVLDDLEGAGVIVPGGTVEARVEGKHIAVTFTVTPLGTVGDSSE